MTNQSMLFTVDGLSRVDTITSRKKKAEQREPIQRMSGAQFMDVKFGSSTSLPRSESKRVVDILFKKD